MEGESLASSSEQSAGVHAPVAESSTKEFIFPPSYAQQRLWLLDRLLPRGSVYNVPKVYRLSGALEVGALRAALDDLVERHESLRTRFGYEESGPVQVIAAQLRLGLEVEDLAGFAPGQREGEARRRAQEEAQAPFDLERGPLLRARLLRVHEQEHWLLLTLHHIITDGWSSGVLVRELSVLYGARCRGEAHGLPALPVQYADYAVWQREWLQGEVLEQQLGYWKPALSELPVLELPTDRPRPAIASFRGDSCAFDVGPELAHALRKLSQREGATLYMTLLAAFQVLLHRYSGQEDVAVGVPIAGRVRPELGGMIGFFVNTLVLRGDLSGDPSFTAYLARVRARALEAYAHQDLPFEKLVEELHPKRDLSRNPLFQVALAMQNTPQGELRLEGIDVEPVTDLSSESAKFDLQFSITEVAGVLRTRVEYATDLFDPSTIERMVGHWRVLLAGIVADPAQPISRLPLLTPQERHQQMQQWNATAAVDSPQASAHESFEGKSESAPQAPTPAGKVDRAYPPAPAAESAVSDDDYAAPRDDTEPTHLRSSTPLDGCVSLVAITTASARPSVFAIAGIGGGTIGFVDLARALGPDQGFYALQSVGLDGAREPLDSIEAMAQLYLSEMRSVQPRGPYALIGACFGATVAYEMARRLAANGEEVAFLGLLEPTQSGGEDAGRPIERSRRVGGKLRTLLRRMSGRASLEDARRETNLTKVYRANVAALRRFERKPLPGNVNVLAIFETPRRAHARADVDWGFASATKVVRHIVAGDDSEDMLNGANARILAAVLAEQLRQAFHP
jgi:thioesterase domain-containing protein